MNDHLKQAKNFIGVLSFGLLLFASCDSYTAEAVYIEAQYNYQQNYEYKSKPLTLLIDDVTPASHRPFDGDTRINTYRFLWDNERDRQWEQDIVYMAHHFREVRAPMSANAAPRIVSGHPLISGIIAPNDRLWNPEIDSSDCLRSGLRGTFLITEYANFYNKELRIEFFDAINDLINIISELDDSEIFFRIVRIMALFGDAHTRIDFNDTTLGTEQLPIIATNHFDEQFSGVHLYSWPHPRTAYVGIDNIINTRLLYINNVSIEEIFNRMRPITSYDYGIKTSFRTLSPPLFSRSVLRYIGVVQNEGIVPVTVRDIDGNVFTVYAPFVASMDEVELTAHQIDMEQFFMASRADENYWLRYFPNESMMYVRVWRCWEMSYPSSTEFAQRLRSMITSKNGVDTFVLDLRSNMGGESLQGFDDFVVWIMDEENRGLLGSVYVVVDEWTNSRGIIKAIIWQNFIEDATLIGSPTSGSLNFFSQPLTISLPNSGFSAHIPRHYVNLAPDLEINSSLIPDIIIYRTLEDYINHHDAVIATIRERAAERRPK